MNRVNPEHAPSSDAFSAALALASAGKAKVRAAALAAHFDPARRDAWVSDVWQELHRRAAVGEPLKRDATRAVLATRIATLAVGGSGISLETFEALLAMLNARVHPVMPSLGSIGAGDLVVLSAMARSLVGEGEAQGRV